MRTLRAGTIKRIHVNRHVIAANAKSGADEPAITIQAAGGPQRARRVTWDGPTCIVHDAAHPLKCGAKVWIVTRAALEFE